MDTSPNVIDVCSDEEVELEDNKKEKEVVRAKRRKRKTKLLSSSDVSFESALASGDAKRRKKQLGHHRVVTLPTSSSSSLSTKFKAPGHKQVKMHCLEECLPSPESLKEHEELTGAVDTAVTTTQPSPPPQSSSFAPPHYLPLVNLSKLAESRGGSHTTAVREKGKSRVVDLTPPKPLPTPSFSVLKKKTAEFNS